MEECAKAARDYQGMYQTAMRGYREAKRKQGLRVQVEQDQLDMFAAGPSSGSDTAHASAVDIPPVQFANEYARVAYSPLERTPEYAMERYVLLIDAFLSVPFITRSSLVSASTGLVPVVGQVCPDCQSKMGHGTRVRTLHAASSQASNKLQEARCLLPDDEWEARVCPSCQRNPKSKHKATVHRTREDFDKHVASVHFTQQTSHTCCFCDVPAFKKRGELTFHLAQDPDYALDGGFAEYRHATQQWYQRTIGNSNGLGGKDASAPIWHQIQYLSSRRNFT